MARVSTDDDARRQKFVWLGPVNSPWPFEAQGRSWVMALVICPPLIILAGIPTWALLSPITSTPAAVIITGTIALAGGTALGVRAVTILSRTISDTRPLRHLVWTLIAEADAPRPVTMANREDLRDIPLVTIDPADARDRDDARITDVLDKPGLPISLQFDEKRVRVSNTCNRMGGEYRYIQTDQVEVQQVQQTLMACADARLMAAESRIGRRIAAYLKP